MLQKMGCDTESDSCCATGDDIHLVLGSQCWLWASEVAGSPGLVTYFPTEVWNVLVWIELVSGD